MCIDKNVEKYRSNLERFCKLNISKLYHHKAQTMFACDNFVDGEILAYKTFLRHIHAEPLKTFVLEDTTDESSTEIIEASSIIEAVAIVETFMHDVTNGFNFKNYILVDDETKEIHKFNPNMKGDTP